MKKNYVYLTKEQSLFLKGIAIFCILSHNFFHLFSPITFENEMLFNAEYFAQFLQDFSWKNSLNCFFSFFGFYGVYVFIILSGYGLCKKYQSQPQKPLSFTLKYIFKTYKLLIFSSMLYLILAPEIQLKGLLYVLTLSANFDAVTLYAACGPWWFFALIIQLYILFFFLYKIISKDIFNIVFILFFYLLSAISWSKYIGVTTIFYANALGHLPEFCLGIFVACYEEKLSFIHSQKLNLTALLISLIVIIAAQLNIYAFMLSFTFSTILFLSAYKLFPSQNNFWIFTGKISPFLFGLNGFLFREYFVSLAEQSSSVWEQNGYWLIWLFINYAFAYASYKLFNLKKALISS